MKTLTSHLNRSLPAILVILFIAFTAAAQTGDLQPTCAETPSAVNTLDSGALPRSETFNISGDLTANMFNTTHLFNIGDSRMLNAALCCNFFAGNARPNNTGSWNAFIGYEAGLSNTSGKYNSFIGTYAGAANREGSNNTFIGSYAGKKNSYGRHNSFLGYNAGRSNDNGSNNTFLGSEAGYNNTAVASFVTDLKTGNSNLFAGARAGYYNTVGSDNTFLGEKAGENNTFGMLNLFIGQRAGKSNTEGDNNTIIGAGADVSSVKRLTYATAIGSDAKVETDNTIVLGRLEGIDKVRVPGLGSGGSDHLCYNPISKEISTCGSSLRYKKNVTPFSSGLSLLRQLRPIRFEWKEGGMKDVGFGAEDIAAVEPLLATYNEKGEVEGVKYDRISTVLVNAVKEQQAQLEAQQQQLKDQQTQLEKQQAVIEGLKKLLCGQNPEAEVCRR